MDTFLWILFAISGLVAATLRLVLVNNLEEHLDWYSKLGEPSPLRFGDALAIRLFQYFEKFSLGLRVASVVHLIAWCTAWTLPFVLVAREIFMR